MVADPLYLPTATWGGHMGHFLLSMLILSGSTPLGIMAARSAEVNSKFHVQDKPHKSLQGAQAKDNDTTKEDASLSITIK